MAQDAKEEQKEKIQKFVDENILYFQQDQISQEVLQTVRSLIIEFLETFADLGLPSSKDNLRVNFNQAYPGCENMATYDLKENIMFLPAESLGRISRPAEKAAVMHELQHFYNDVKDFAQYTAEDRDKDYQELVAEFNSSLSKVKTVKFQDFISREEYEGAKQVAIKAAKTSEEKLKSFDFYVAIPRSRINFINDEIKAHQTEIAYLERHASDFRERAKYEQSLASARASFRGIPGAKNKG